MATYVVFLDSIPGSDRANTRARVDAVLRSVGNIVPTEVFEHINGFTVDLTEQQSRRLRSLAGVKSVEVDSIVQLLEPSQSRAVPRDPITGISGLPVYADEFVSGSSGERVPWGVNAVWAGNRAGYLANPGEGKYAFVIDTGISSNTGDLNVNTVDGYNWVNSSSNAEDDNGHGTHVAGTIGALANGYGVVGVAAGSTMVPLKVLDANGSGSLSRVISAINYVFTVCSRRQIPIGSAVVNLSLGAKSSYSSLDTAIRNSANQGLRFAIAAGNSGQDVDGFTPARSGSHANAYTVSAVDSSYRMASWSNWDRLTSTDTIDNIDVAAPGVNVMSLSHLSGYLATMSGTSMAAPHVAGLLLTGGVVSGTQVVPFYTGTADPFAMHA